MQVTWSESTARRWLSRDPRAIPKVSMLRALRRALSRWWRQKKLAVTRRLSAYVNGYSTCDLSTFYGMSKYLFLRGYYQRLAAELGASDGYYGYWSAIDKGVEAGVFVGTSKMVNRGAHGRIIQPKSNYSELILRRRGEVPSRAEILGGLTAASGFLWPQRFRMSGRDAVVVYRLLLRGW